MFATANKEYQLVCLICHEGETLNRHYYSLIR
jgi:ubiquitin C-terminal hydrolase